MMVKTLNRRVEILFVVMEFSSGAQRHSAMRTQLTVVEFLLFLGGRPSSIDDIVSVIRMNMLHGKGLPHIR